MNKKLKLRVLFWTLPFIIFPVIAFTAWWFSVPFTIMAVLMWVGVIHEAAKLGKEEENK
jgi:hypothetical protein